MHVAVMVLHPCAFIKLYFVIEHAEINSAALSAALFTIGL